MLKYWKRVTRSSRGELFNPLLWPFLLSTLSYGIGFGFVIPLTGDSGLSSLYVAMASMSPVVPVIWGILAVGVIAMGFTFLLFNVPPFGKISGLIGFALWAFATMAYILSGDFIVLFAVAVPSMWFWVWQYLSLSVFRKEDAEDKYNHVSNDIRPL